MWDHLPLRLLGAVFEARFPLWPGDVVYWYWLRNGVHYRELAGSRDWLFDNWVPSDWVFTVGDRNLVAVCVSYPDDEALAVDIANFLSERYAGTGLPVVAIPEPHQPGRVGRLGGRR